MLPILFTALLVATWIDLRTHRIPNWLTLSSALLGVAWHAWCAGAAGFGMAVGGLAVGLACFLPSYLFGAMGAGDVKLMAAAGAFVGPVEALVAALAAVVAGGIIAMARITWRGGAGPMAMRYGTMLMMLWATRRLAYVAPARGEPAAERFPYAAAIAAGVVVAVLWTG